MSRVGRLPINIPEGTEVNKTGNKVTVKGPKGQLEKEFHPEIDINIEDGVINVTRPTNKKQHRALHGLTRALLNNLVQGVTNGFQKGLELTGVGYRANMQGKKLVLHVGYSQPVEMEPPAGIEIETPVPTKIIVKGIDKELVGAIAANIRKVREPEPYKGKGIRYEGERIRRKVGKAGSAK
ncbi:50S ribosomal protein L6 [Metallumcola ferriviriculae]|uniref:Large ribosomal subunit protein uL6 n=1 Tax=Metallumcola ferriviriculae TaxID=3039180 RepID=A0AAU0UHY9_9FIRM|nr:50S ribosomal protein L6 [Desulfitibacteraceae bacterium MK1]